MTKNSRPRKSETICEKALREPLTVPEHLGGHPGEDVPRRASRECILFVSASRECIPVQQAAAASLALGQPPSLGGGIQPRGGLRRGVSPPHGPPIGVPSRYVLLVNLLIVWDWFVRNWLLYFHNLPCNNLTRLPIFFRGSSNRGITRSR